MTVEVTDAIRPKDYSARLGDTKPLFEKNA